MFRISLVVNYPVVSHLLAALPRAIGDRLGCSFRNSPNPNTLNPQSGTSKALDPGTPSPTSELVLNPKNP